MCGISGLLASRPVSPSLGEAMTARLHHRGPDGDGLFAALDGRLLLGHDRLSIVDLSEANAQPFTDPGSGVSLIFNGEIYNFQDLRAELQARGHVFHTTGDTEVVLRGWLEWGEAVLARLAGMFAFALWDPRDRSLLLTRDTFGIKPLYYYLDDERLVFGSEVKALFLDPSVPRRLHLPAVIDLASFGFHLSHETVYAGIRQLPPGALLRARLDGERVRAEVRDFLTLAEVVTESLENSARLTADDVREQLAASVRSHLVSDAPLAMSLSGGLDSSAVCALASQANPAITCYTVGYGLESDETPFARRVSQRLGIRQVVANARVTDMSGLLRRLAWHLEEPVANIQALTPYFLGQMLRADGIKVVLLGEGADEVFGGYPWHALGNLPLTPGLTFDLYARGRRARDAQLRLLFGPERFERDVRPRLREQAQVFRQRWQAVPGTRLQKFLYFDASFQLTYSQLLRVDKMLMAHSVEGRVPFLHVPLLRALWSLADRQRTAGPRPRRPVVHGKLALRQAMRGLLPDEVVDRIKFGAGGTQNLYQIGLNQAVGQALAGLDELRPELDFLNWDEPGMTARLAPKLQFFLALLAQVARDGLRGGFEPLQAPGQPVELEIERP